MNTPAEIDRLVRSCLPLVQKIAAQYWGNGVEYEDLVGAGNMGLVKAAQRYDEKRGYKFTTYSSYWIKASMYMLIECATGKRLTQSERKLFYHSKKARQVIGLEATDEQVAEYLGVDDVSLAAFRARKMLSLDVKIPGGDDDGTFIDTKPSNDETPEELFGRLQNKRRAKQLIAATLAKLNDRERTIIKARFFSDEKKTLNEIGIELGGLSRERVRQIEERVLKRLKFALAEVEG
jgi:RNA polymerase sigma factor (sigma-70 family)